MPIFSLWALFLDNSAHHSSISQHVRLHICWIFWLMTHQSRPLQTTFSSILSKYLSSFASRAGTSGLCGWFVHCLARSPTVSSGPPTGALPHTGVAQSFPPAPQTGTGLVACRLRPDCTRTDRAKPCRWASGGYSQSVHNRHTSISSVTDSTVPPKNF